MVWRASLGFSLFVAAFAASAAADRARAAEAYLCGPDTIVYVKAEDLELKKRTDPCIAGHFGLTVSSPDAAPPPAVSVPPKSASKKSAPRRSAAKLRTLSDTDVASSEPPRPERHAAIAAPETDFRNVRILNPESPNVAWYRHDK